MQSFFFVVYKKKFIVIIELCDFFHCFNAIINSMYIFLIE